MWTLEEILWKRPAELFTNLQGEPPSRKPGKGQEISAKGPNQESNGTAQEKSDISRNIERQENGDKTRGEALQKNVP